MQQQRQQRSAGSEGEQRGGEESELEELSLALCVCDTNITYKHSQLILTAQLSTS